MYAMTPRETRILHHYGIEIRGQMYSHPTLGLLRKQNVREVDIRYHDHDLDHIEVFVDGTHECTATRTEVQPQHQRFGVLSIRPSNAVSQKPWCARLTVNASCKSTNGSAKKASTSPNGLCCRTRSSSTRKPTKPSTALSPPPGSTPSARS